jgi:hypothetical protein
MRKSAVLEAISQNERRPTILVFAASANGGCEPAPRWWSARGIFLAVQSVRAFLYIDIPRGFRNCRHSDPRNDTEKNRRPKPALAGQQGQFGSWRAPMEHLNDLRSVPEFCAICGNRKKQNEVWFHMTENCWEDRLNICKWNADVSRLGTAHSLCSPRHVRELAVHWMTTGCLHYPFASAPYPSTSTKPKLVAGTQAAPECPSGRHRLGELAVDRQGIARALKENPLSLNSILDELMIVLENQIPKDTEAEFEHKPAFALRSV